MCLPRAYKYRPDKIWEFSDPHSDPSGRGGRGSGMGGERSTSAAFAHCAKLRSALRRRFNILLGKLFSKEGRCITYRKSYCEDAPHGQGASDFEEDAGKGKGISCPSAYFCEVQAQDQDAAEEEGKGGTSPSASAPGRRSHRRASQVMDG